MEGTLEQLLMLNPARLDIDGQLSLVLALDRLVSRASARMDRTLAMLADPHDEKDIIREEVRCQLRWSDGYTRARMAQAVKLATDLPEALDRHEAGELNTAQARAIAEACEPLDRKHCAEVLERVLPRAGAQTVTEFRHSVTRAVHRVDPRTAEKKHTDAKKQRDVFLRPLPHGMAGIYSIHDAVDAEAILARVNAVAAATKNAPNASGDPRLVRERRADAMANLILGVDCPEQATQHGRRPTVSIVVPLEVAMGASDVPGDLVGHGPIPATLCRQAMADETARFVRWVVSPLGEILDCSSTYEPSQALQDLIIARDRTCRMPGCNRKAGNCELDHRIDFDGHNTTEANLQALCCRHHHLKTETDWQVHKAYDGTTAWVSPTGRVYTTPPDHLPGFDDTWRDQNGRHENEQDQDERDEDQDDGATGEQNDPP